MIPLYKNLDYEYYYLSSKKRLENNHTEKIDLRLEIDDDTASKLYTANFFLRGPSAYCLIGKNISHLNKLTANLFEYYKKHNKDINIIPFDTTIDAFSNMNYVFMYYVIFMLEKYLTPKEIEEYKKEAEKDHIYGLSEELNISTYYRHIITKINEKKIKVLFIVNNAQLVNKIEFDFEYNRRETYVRFLVTSTSIIREHDEALESIFFDSKYLDVFNREIYLKEEIKAPLNKLEIKKLNDNYKKYDPSYIDVIINIFNNYYSYYHDIKEIKDIFNAKTKPNNALDFINLLIKSLPEEYHLYSILPFIFASPFGVTSKEIKNIFKDFHDERIKYEIVRFNEDISSLIFLDIDESYRFYDNQFVLDIKKYYSFDIYHASFIASKYKTSEELKNLKGAINYLYQLYKCNDKYGLKKFIDLFKDDDYIIVLSLHYLVNFYVEDFTNYIRNYLHLLSKEELSYLLYTLYNDSVYLDLENEYFLFILERIRQCIEDLLPASGLNQEELKLLIDSLICVGEYEGTLGNNKNKTLYLFHAYIYRNEYNRLYNQKDFDKDYKEAGPIIFEYSSTITDDKIDKKERYRPISEYDVYDLKIGKYLSSYDLVNAKATLLELFNSYSINMKDHTLDIVYFYHEFNFKMEINEILMYFFLYLLIKDIGDIKDHKILSFIQKKYLDYFYHYDA